MSIDLLAFVVTGLGIVLCASLIAIVMLGKRIDSDADGPQELEFKGVRAKTNVIIMFLILSLIPAVAPLYWLLHRPGGDQTPDVATYEKWKISGRIDAQDPDTSTLLVQPPHPRVNADGSFFSDVPVMRSIDGKLHFPSFIIEHPAYRSQSIDLAALKQPDTFGGIDLKAEIKDADRLIVLHAPIKLIEKRAKTAGDVAAAGAK
jgi:hypothetical protein